MIDAGTARGAPRASATDRRRRPTGRSQQLHDHRHRKFGGVDSLGGATLAVFDLPTAQACSRKQGVRRDRRGRARRASRRRSSLASSSRCCPPTARSRASAAQRAGRAPSRSSRASSAPAHVPARVRRHRAVRRRVRHLQHALDHRRPAHPRARDAADPGRLAAAGAALGVLETLVIGVVASAIGLVARARPRQGPRRALRRARLGAAEGRHRARGAHGGHLARRRHARDAARRPRPRDPRHPRAADRRGPRGRGRCRRRGSPAARRSSRPRSALVASPRSRYGAVRRRRRTAQGRARCRSAPARSAVPRRRACSRRASSGRSPRSSAGPPERLGGSAGALARANAVRNPGRTASTAAALMIGLALVTFVATLGAGPAQLVRRLTSSAQIDGRLRRHLGGNGGDPSSAGGRRAIASLPGVTSLERAQRQGPRRSARRPAWTASTRRRSAAFYRFRSSAGSGPRWSPLGARRRDRAARASPRSTISQIGSRLPLQTPTGDRR